MQWHWSSQLQKKSHATVLHGLFNGCNGFSQPLCECDAFDGQRFKTLKRHLGFRLFGSWFSISDLGREEIEDEVGKVLRFGGPFSSSGVELCDVCSNDALAAGKYSSSGFALAAGKPSPRGFAFAAGKSSMAMAPSLSLFFSLATTLVVSLFVDPLVSFRNYASKDSWIFGCNGSVTGSDVQDLTYRAIPCGGTSHAFARKEISTNLTSGTASHPSSGAAGVSIYIANV